MLTEKKYRNFKDDSYKDWSDVPEAQIYYLDVLIRSKGAFFTKMQWEGLQPDRGLQTVQHYISCETCQKTARGKGCYAVLVFCNKRFVYGFDVRNNVVLSHEKDYKQYLRSLI